MACLLQEMDDWIESEPPDLDDDHPSKEEIAAYEESQEAHKDKVSRGVKY
jgi:hypothetical protein